jgi:hypothetical protein
MAQGEGEKQEVRLRRFTQGTRSILWKASGKRRRRMEKGGGGCKAAVTTVHCTPVPVGTGCFSALAQIS